MSSENPLAAQYAQTILGRIVCCDTPDTLEQHPDSATRDLLRTPDRQASRLERLAVRAIRYIGLGRVKRTPFVIAVRVESRAPMRAIRRGIFRRTADLEQLPIIDPRPAAQRKGAGARNRPLSLQPQPPDCSADWASGAPQQKFTEVFQMGTSMDSGPISGVLYQYILPQPTGRAAGRPAGTGKSAPCWRNRPRRLLEEISGLWPGNCPKADPDRC